MFPKVTAFDICSTEVVNMKNTEKQYFSPERVQNIVIQKFL